MDVAECLGLVGDPEGRLADAGRRWPAWAREHPVLGVLKELRLPEFRDWLFESGWERSDQMLRALVSVAASDREDAAAAASVVAWALLPAAISLANSVRELSPDGDAIVAGQLWLEIRTFDVTRGSKVAAGIIWKTRSKVLLELGATAAVARADQAWSRTVLCGDSSMLPQPFANVEPEPEPAEELEELLSCSRQAGVISAADLVLLRNLVASASTHTPRYALGAGGLLGDGICQDVGRRIGASMTTVRRHARRSIRALAEAGRSA